MKISDIPMECPECGWEGKCGDCELDREDGCFMCPKCLSVVKEIKIMMPRTQRDEMIDLANRETELLNKNADLIDQCIELLEALKPFVEAGEGVNWAIAKNEFVFYPVNSVDYSSGSIILSKFPISMGDLRHAMKIYKKYKGSENEKNG